MNFNIGLKAIAGGTADAMTATYAPAVTLSEDRIVYLRAIGANTTLVPTFNPDGLGAKVIKKTGGLSLNLRDYVAGQNLILQYHTASGGYWELLNPRIGISNQRRKYGSDNYTGYHGPFKDVFNPVTVSTGRDIQHIIPFDVDEPVNATEYVIEVTGAGSGGSVIRCAVYRDNGNNFPGALLFDAGTVTGDSNAVKTIAIDQNFDPAGIYHFLLWHNSVANITVRAVGATGGAISGRMGVSKTTFTGGAFNRISRAEVYSAGALPDPFPTTGLTIGNFTIPCPLLLFNTLL